MLRRTYYSQNCASLIYQDLTLSGVLIYYDFFIIGYRWSDYPDLKPCGMKVKWLVCSLVLEHIAVLSKWKSKEQSMQQKKFMVRISMNNSFTRSSSQSYTFYLGSLILMLSSIGWVFASSPTPSIRHWWWNSCRQAFMTIFSTPTQTFLPITKVFILLDVTSQRAGLSPQPH